MGTNQYLNIFKFQNRQERQKILDIVKNQKIENRIATRARMLILREEGKNQTQIGKILKVHRNTVMLWEKRYKAEGIEGLYDKPGRGRKPIFSPTRQVGNIISSVSIT
jgi:DNA-binding XRE family transcriptional regulator